MSVLFACKISDRDYVASFAPEQPAEVAVGQEWMDLESASILPVKAVRNDYIDLGGACYTKVVTEESLRAEFVCIDAPDNVTEIRRA